MRNQYRDSRSRQGCAPRLLTVAGSASEPAVRHDAGMSTGDHYKHPPRPCWYCVHWAGPAWGDPYLARCTRGGGSSCVANAGNGCVHWMRETGVDDDDWSPAALILPKSPDRKPFEMTPDLYAVIRQIQADVDRKANISLIRCGAGSLAWLCGQSAPGQPIADWRPRSSS